MYGLKLPPHPFEPYLSTLREDGSVFETDKHVMDILLVNRAMSLPKDDLKNYEPTKEPFDISSVSKEVKSQPFPLIISVMFLAFFIDIIDYLNLTFVERIVFGSNYHTYFHRWENG